MTDIKTESLVWDSNTWNNLIVQTIDLSFYHNVSYKLFVYKS